MGESAPITGRCLCGRVRFQVSEPLLEAEYCHCKRCQRRTGTSASASAMTAPGTFRVTEGEELWAHSSPTTAGTTTSAASAAATYMAKVTKIHG